MMFIPVDLLPTVNGAPMGSVTLAVHHITSLQDLTEGCKVIMNNGTIFMIKPKAVEFLGKVTAQIRLAGGRR